MINDVIERGIGETNLSTTIEDANAFRFVFDMRPNFATMSKISAEFHRNGDGMSIPLAEVADIKMTEGASMINSENGLLKGTVLLNVRERDIGSFVEEADKIIKQRVQMPAGYYISWSGQFENQQRAKQRLLLVVPIVLIVIFVLLYFTYNSAVEAAHVLLAVPLP